MKHLGGFDEIENFIYITFIMLDMYMQRKNGEIYTRKFITALAISNNKINKSLCRQAKQQQNLIQYLIEN